MKPQFYKIIPNQLGAKPLKPKFFLSKNEIKKKSIEIMRILHDDIFLNGIKDIVPVDKTDKDFIEYAKNDLAKVEKEIQDKIELRDCLKLALI